MDKTIASVLEKIENCGYEAYVVGGFVRDYVLGIKSTDIDIATNALPKDLADIFDNYDINSSEYGAFKLVTDTYNFDITTYRKEYEYIDRRPNKIEYVNNLLDDLQRRDFTINTLCMNSKGEVIDLLNAKKDIDNKVIKMVGNASIKFHEDPLRILRAIRFSTTLGFEIEESLLAAIVTYKDLINTLSWTRKKYELDCILTSENAVKGLEFMKTIGISSILGLSYDEVKYVSDKCGMYSQINVSEDFPFTSSEKSTINNIKEIVSYGKIDNNILFDYGLYHSIVAGAILDIDVKDINEMFSALPIKSINDIDVNSKQICEILNIEPSKVIKDILNELKDLILINELQNNFENIQKYIIMNAGKWLNEGNDRKGVEN